MHVVQVEVVMLYLLPKLLLLQPHELSHFSIGEIVFLYLLHWRHARVILSIRLAFCLASCTYSDLLGRLCKRRSSGHIETFSHLSLLHIHLLGRANAEIALLAQIVLLIDETLPVIQHLLELSILNPAGILKRGPRAMIAVGMVESCRGASKVLERLLLANVLVMLSLRRMH